MKTTKIIALLITSLLLTTTSNAGPCFSTCRRKQQIKKPIRVLAVEDLTLEQKVATLKNPRRDMRDFRYLLLTIDENTYCVYVKQLYSSITATGALKDAVYHGDADMVYQALIEDGNPNEIPSLDDLFIFHFQKDDFMYPRGGSSMHQLALHFNPTIATYLISAGGNVNIVNHKNQTPLYFACGIDNSIEKGFIDAAKFFLSNGANPDIQDSWGNTALHRICHYSRCKRKVLKERYFTLIKLLVTAGANISLTNSDGKTALQLAELNDKQWVKKAIIKGLKARKRALMWPYIATVIASSRASQDELKELSSSIIPRQGKGLIPTICAFAGLGTQQQCSKINNDQDAELTRLQELYNYQPKTTNKDSNDASSNSTSSMTVSSMSALSSSSSSSSSSSNGSNLNGLD